MCWLCQNDVWSKQLFLLTIWFVSCNYCFLCALRSVFVCIFDIGFSVNPLHTPYNYWVGCVILFIVFLVFGQTRNQKIDDIDAVKIKRRQSRYNVPLVWMLFLFPICGIANGDWNQRPFFLLPFAEFIGFVYTAFCIYSTFRLNCFRWIETMRIAHFHSLTVAYCFRPNPDFFFFLRLQVGQ